MTMAVFLRCLSSGHTMIRAFFGKPCTAALQYHDMVSINRQVEWLHFLVRALLLEQWGLEAQGEIWFQGKVCLTYVMLPCITHSVNLALLGPAGAGQNHTLLLPII